MLRVLLPFAVSFSLFAATAHAGLKPFQKKAETKFNDEIMGAKDASADEKKAAPLNATNAKCGSKIVVKSDFSKYKEADWEGNSVSGRCEAVLNAIQSLCDDEAYKPEVVKDIKTVDCAFGGKPGKTADNMKLANGTFTFTMHKDLGNLEDAVKEVIKKKLDE